MPDISRLVIEVDAKGVVKATGDLKAFEGIAGKAGKSTDDAAKKFSAFQLVANKLPGPLKSVASGLMGLVDPATAVVSAFLEIGEAAVKFVKESLEASAKFETIKSGLETVMGSAEQASKTFNELQRMAGRTPFNTEQLAEAAAMLRTTGMSAKELIPTLEMLGNVSGGSAEKFNRIATQFAMIQNTGSATFLTLRQFAMAGIPIYKMLEEMGVKANATAGDVTEAFRRMTEAGGQFHDAMEKASHTYKAVMDRYEEAVLIYKAAWADNSFIGDEIKKFKEEQTQRLLASAESLNNSARLKELEQKKRTFLEEVEYAERKIQQLQYRETIKQEQGYGDSWAFENQTRKYREFLEDNEYLIDLYNRQAEKQNEFNDRLEKSNKGYRDLKDLIEESYAKTTEGQREVIENDIKIWQERLKSTHLQMFDMNLMPTTDKNKVYYTQEVGITDEETQRIEAIIRMLTESRSGVKQELSEWQKIFKSAMGLSDKDIKQDWFRRQSASIAEFSRMLAAANGRAKILSDTFGTELTGSLENAATAWEKIASDMIMSGEWQADTELFLDVVQRAKEAREALNEANLDSYISGLDNELGLLRMTTAEMERQKLIYDFKVKNEKKITEALELQNKIRAQAGINNMISGASGLSIEKLQGLNTFEEKTNEIIKTFFQNMVNNIFLDSNLKKMGLMSDSEFKSNRLSSIENEESTWREMYSMTFTSEFREMADTLGITAREFVEFQNMITDKLKEKSVESRQRREKQLLDDILEQINDAGKSAYERAVKRLVNEQKISEIAAEQLIAEEKKRDYIENGADIMGEIATSIDDALRSIRSGNGGYGQYAGARLAQSGMELVEGSDVGNFIQGFQEGGIWGAILETLIGALTKVIGGMDEMEKAMNPVTELLLRLEGVINFLHEIITQVFDELVDALKPLLALIGEILQAVKPLVSEVIHTITGALKDILSALMPLIAIVKEALAPIFKELAKGLRRFFDGLKWFADKITGGLISQMNEWADTIQLLDGEQQEEAERLRAVNEQYKNLYAALKEQEEYYLQQRRHLNAEWAIENFQRPTPVNDMILSPRGAFSTDPEDYIIATKRPEDLMNGGAAPVYVTVINNANATVSTQERTVSGGAKEIQIIVDGLVQQGMASGKYDGAFDAMSARRSGKRITS